MNIIFFITHTTLNIEHANLVFKSLSKQKNPIKFDKIYIYNSHQHELPNSVLIDEYKKHNIDFINEIREFNYKETSKTLGSDIIQIRNYCLSNYKSSDKVLILKSDILVSKNLFNDFTNIQSQSFIFTPPFICAKKRVSNDIIFDYLNRDKFIKSDDITFFVEDENNSNDNDFYNRTIDITNQQILFFSTTGKSDFSCHYLTLDNLDKISISIQEWGGCNFNQLRSKWLSTDNGFTVHKYHRVLSENCNKDRQGPVETWLLS
jgi:hypothetical protein